MRPNWQSNGIIGNFSRLRELTKRVTVLFFVISQPWNGTRVIYARTYASRRQGFDHFGPLRLQSFLKDNALAIVTALKIPIGALELVNLLNRFQLSGNNFMVFLSFLQKTRESINLNGSNRSLQLIHAIVETQKIHIVLAGNFTFAVRTIDTKGTL